MMMSKERDGLVQQEPFIIYIIQPVAIAYQKFSINAGSYAVDILNGLPIYFINNNNLAIGFHQIHNAGFMHQHIAGFIFGKTYYKIFYRYVFQHGIVCRCINLTLIIIANRFFKRHYPYTS